MARYGAVEMGGTRTSVGVGSSPDDLGDSLTLDTTGPEETLGAVVGYLREHEIDAAGIAAFGPLDLVTGRIGVTPKQGWSQTDLVGAFQSVLDVPVGLDTDVNGAALGESRWGAGRDLRSIVYITVGTGIGGGALIDGEPVHGLGHPEMGHISVRRHPDDHSPGVCPFHGGCLEGLASGPAIAARSGTRSEDLTGADLRGAVELEGFYLGQLVAAVVYLLAPERVIMGGGVSGLPGLTAMVVERLMIELSDYPGHPQHGSGFVVTPGLGRLSGLAGGLVLAERALENVKRSG